MFNTKTTSKCCLYFDETVTEDDSTTFATGENESLFKV